MPNTQDSQEILTHYLEHYEENLQAHMSFEPPLIFGVQKGRFDRSVNVC